MAAIAALVAVFFAFSQARHDRAELQDKRIDEKVKGVIGENILLINGLTEQARATLEKAQQSGATVEVISNTVRTMAADLEVQKQNAAQARNDLIQSLASAQEVVKKLNSTAEQANEDAQVIGQTRRAVETNAELMQEVESILLECGYHINSDRVARLLADIIATSSEDHKSGNVLIIKVSSIDPAKGVADTLSKSLTTINNFQGLMETHPNLFKNLEPFFIIVVDHDLSAEDRAALGSLGRRGHLLTIDHFRDFIVNELPRPVNLADKDTQSLS